MHADAPSKPRITYLNKFKHPPLQKHCAIQHLPFLFHQFFLILKSIKLSYLAEIPPIVTTINYPWMFPKILGFVPPKSNPFEKYVGCSIYYFHHPFLDILGFSPLFFRKHPHFTSCFLLWKLRPTPKTVTPSLPTVASTSGAGSRPS